MADYVVMPKADYQDIVDATREKTGKSDLLKSGDVGAQIRGISVGGEGITPSGTKEITENGEYDVSVYEKANVNVPVPDGYIQPSGVMQINENGSHDVSGYASAEVDVETPTEDLTITENGEYSPSEGKHFGKVTAAVPVPDGYIQPNGTKQITENGVHDVSEFESAEVDIETPTEELSVTENGEYTPSEGKHFSKVSVNVPTDNGGVILPTLSNPAASAQVLDGYGAIDADGNAFTGSMPNNGAISETIDGINEKSVTIPEGYTSGGTVSLTDDIDTEVTKQADLIAQIKAVLATKAGGTSEDAEIPSGTGDQTLIVVFSSSNSDSPPESLSIGVSINDAAATYHDVTFGEEFVLKNLGASDDIKLYIPTPGNAVCEPGDNENTATVNDWDASEENDVTIYLIEGVGSGGYFYITINYYE